MGHVLTPRFNVSPEEALAKICPIVNLKLGTIFGPVQQTGNMFLCIDAWRSTYPEKYLSNTKTASEDDLMCSRKILAKK